MTTLYLGLGGIAAMRNAASLLYDLLCADAELTARAEKINERDLKLRLEAFLTFTFGGSPYYEGDSLRTDYEALLLSDGDFDRFCAHILATLEALNASTDAREDATMVVEQMRDFVLNKPVAQTA